MTALSVILSPNSDNEVEICWDRWMDRERARIFREPRPAEPPRVAEEITRYAATCGSTRVILAREAAARWTMYIDAKRKKNRVRPFATPFLSHAQRSARIWFGEPAGAWEAVVPVKRPKP